MMEIIEPRTIFNYRSVEEGNKIRGHVGEVGMYGVHYDFALHVCITGMVALRPAIN